MNSSYHTCPNTCHYSYTTLTSKSAYYTLDYKYIILICTISTELQILFGLFSDTIFRLYYTTNTGEFADFIVIVNLVAFVGRWGTLMTCLSSLHVCQSSYSPIHAVIPIHCVDYIVSILLVSQLQIIEWEITKTYMFTIIQATRPKLIWRCYNQ